MAMPVSGPLSFSAMQTEFGGANPIGFSEYYRNGGLVPTNGTTGSIATSGAINMATFYGAATGAVGPTLSTTGVAGNLGADTGLSVPAFGSIVSNITSDGKAVKTWSQNSGSGNASVSVNGFGADPGQNGWATSFRINAVTKTTASASSYSYNAGAGQAQWTWNATNWSFSNGAGFTAQIA